MPRDELHFEPYVHLAGLTATRALLSWGGFFFRPGATGGTATAATTGSRQWMVVDDASFDELQPKRHESIGRRSRSYGPAEVRVFDERDRLVAHTRVRDRNHAWIEGLAPDTRYRYELRVDGRSWLTGERYDWGCDASGRRGLHRSGERYECTFRTHPDPARPSPLTFAALGDFGVGIRTDHADAARQRRIAHGLARAVERFDVRLILTLGDNVYLGRERTGATGDEDDDWFFTFYQPYRYLLSRVPFYPAVGNHDASDTEKSDDRGQLEDNFYLQQRFAERLEAERSVVDPGLFYTFRYGADVEFVCIDTTCTGDRFFQRPKPRAFLEETLPERPQGARWRIPFSHHPVYCAGPHHGNTDGMESELVPLFRRAGVRLVLAGHEHNFQHSLAAGIHYLVAGAAGKLRPGTPQHFEAAHTCDWAAREHFLVVEIDGERATVRPLTVGDDGEPVPLERATPAGERRTEPIQVRAGDA